MPRQFIPSVEKGVRWQMDQGVTAGYPMTGVRVTLYDGKAHSVDSSDMAFQKAGRLALRDAVDKAQPMLLEPVDEVSVLVPDEYVGAVMSDLSSRRGRVLGTEPVGVGRTLVKAEIPELEITRYAIDLRSVSHGTGSFTRSYLRHEPLPSHLAAKVAADSKPRLGRERAGQEDRPGVGEQLTGVGQELGQHPGAPGDRHEVGVAAPPGHHVLVQVGGDAGAGHRAQVDADVEALGAGGLAQRARPRAW